MTINYGNDWNYHKTLSQKINDFTFITIFNTGIYEVTLDKKYYLACDKAIVIPVKENEYKNIRLCFIIYEDYAIMNIYLYNDIIARFRINVYLEEELDLNMMIEALN